MNVSFFVRSADGNVYGRGVVVVMVMVLMVIRSVSLVVSIINGRTVIDGAFRYLHAQRRSERRALADDPFEIRRAF